jgi:hypothetical protein
MDITVDQTKLQPVGNNVKMAMVGTLMVLVVDTAVTIGPSSSGKMIGFGSTEGFSNLTPTIKGNIWIGKKA